MKLISETEVDTVRVDHSWTIAEETSKLITRMSFRPPMVHRWSTRGRKGSFFVVIRRTKNLLEDFVIIKNSKNLENLEKVLKSAHNPKVRGSNPLPATNSNWPASDLNH
jgi:hypothetical protein